MENVGQWYCDATVKYGDAMAVQSYGKVLWRNGSVQSGVILCGYSKETFCFRHVLRCSGAGYVQLGQVWNCEVTAGSRMVEEQHRVVTEKSNFWRSEMEEREYRIWTEKDANLYRVGTEEEKQVNLTDLMNEYEQLEAQIQELNDRKQRIRKILYGELVDRNIEETSVITASGTKFVLRIQKTRRERVDVKLLRADLGEKAERYITVTETEFLSIRPAKKDLTELGGK